MRYPFVRGVLPLVVSTLLLGSAGALALEAGGNVRLSVTHTDNALRDAVNEIDDQIVTAQVNGNIKEDQGALTGSADVTLRELDYINDTFGSQTYLGLSAQAQWEQVQNVLTWEVRDHYTQTDINTLASSTPSNTQDFNAFRLGAAVNFKLGSRQQLTLRPTFDDFYYEATANDNQQTGLTATWSYSLSPRTSLSVAGGYKQTEYDNAGFFDSETTNATVGVSGTGARLSYSASFGFASVDRDMLADSDGTIASLRLSYILSGRSELQAFVTSNITDTSSIYLGTAIDPVTGNIVNVQTSPDTVRNNTARISYTRTGNTVSTSVWAEARDLDYSTTLNDRKVQEFGVTAGYRVTSDLTANASASYRKNKDTDQAIEQELQTLGVGLAYHLSRRINLDCNVAHQSKDSTLVASEYDELRVSAGIGYTFAP